MTPNNALHFQRRFLRLVSQPRPIPEAARMLSTDDPSILPLRNWVEAATEQEAVEKLGIYAHMYYARLRDSLREDFAVFASLVSETVFDRLAARYIQAHPSQDPSLRYHGQHFPAFLQCQLTDERSTFLGIRPDAPDLCRLECARIDVFDERDARPMTHADLANLGPGDWDSLELATIPAVRFVSTDYAVTDLWSAAVANKERPPVVRQQQQILVWRRGFATNHRALEHDEQAAICLLARGASFPEVCECFVRPNDGSIRNAAERALHALRRWLADEILAGAVNSGK